MSVKQISVFVENKPGQLARFTEILNSNRIDMRALSLAEAEDFGIVRVIVDDSYKAATVLKEEGYIFSINEVLAVELPDTPGALFNVLNIIRQGGVNIEYAYAFITRKPDVAYMIFRVTDNDAAAKVLNENGIRLLSQEDLD